MALQNFFLMANNKKRQNYSQMSGKELYAEFRMRVNGESKQLLDVVGFDNNDGTITVQIIVKDPKTNEIIFGQEIVCPK